MGDAKKSEDEKESPPLRLDFYTVYNKEANEYDLDHVKKYDEDLNTTLIFVRLSLCALANGLT